MKTKFLFLFTLLAALSARGADPVRISDMTETNAAHGLSLTHISAVGGGGGFTTRSMTLSNLWTWTMAAHATKWHGTNTGPSFQWMSNSTVVLSMRGSTVGVNTNTPQASLHVFGGSTEPALLVESSTDDIDHIRVVGPTNMTLAAIDSAGQLGGRLYLNDQGGNTKILFSPGSWSYLNSSNGLAINTNNPSGYKLYVVGNAYFADGVVFGGSSTNLGDMRHIGAVTYPNLSSNYVMVLDALNRVSVGTVLATNLAENTIERGQAVPIAATNAINWATKAQQYTTVSNNTAFTFTASTNVYGQLLLFVFNDGVAARTLSWPHIPYKVNGVDLPTTIDTNEFLVVPFFQVNGSLVAGYNTPAGVTLQSNAVTRGTAQYLNIIPGSNISITMTNLNGTNHLGIASTASGGSGIATLDGQGTNTTFRSTATNDALKVLNNGGTLAFYFASNGIPHVASSGTDFMFDATAGTIFVGGEQLLTLDSTDNYAEVTGSIVINGGPMLVNSGGTLSVSNNSAAANAPLLVAGLTATDASINNLTTVSNHTWTLHTGAADANLTNWIVNFARAEWTIPASAITNNILALHTTNRPSAGQVRYSVWRINTGNTNRHLYLNANWQGNIYGTNTSTSTFLLPSNSVARIVWEAAGSAETDVYLSYPILTP